MLKPPKLSTSFSAEGKQAKRRLDNILNLKSKKKGIAVLILLFLCFLTIGVSFAVGSTKEREEKALNQTQSHSISDATITKLYQAKLDYVGNASGVSNILGLLDTNYEKIELQTAKAPYGVICYLKSNADLSPCEAQASVFLSLVKNADYLSFVCGNYTQTYRKSDLEKTYQKSLTEFLNSETDFKRFYQNVYQRQNKRDKAIADAIMGKNREDYLEGECSAQGHVLLATQRSENGNSQRTVLYLLTTYGEYGFENNNFVKISGTGIIPVKLTLDADNHVVEYWTPQDGSYYAPDIKKTFPEELYSRVIPDLDTYRVSMEQCTKQEESYAQTYLNSIGRKAKIGDENDFEQKRPDISANAWDQILKDVSSVYPTYIGTREKVENGKRYLYETKWESSGKEKGQLVFQKQEYQTKKIENKIIVNVDGDKVTYQTDKAK